MLDAGEPFSVYSNALPPIPEAVEKPVGVMGGGSLTQERQAAETPHHRWTHALGVHRGGGLGLQPHQEHLGYQIHARPAFFK